MLRLQPNVLSFPVAQSLDKVVFSVGSGIRSKGRALDWPAHASSSVASEERLRKAFPSPQPARHLP